MIGAARAPPIKLYRSNPFRASLHSVGLHSKLQKSQSPPPADCGSSRSPMGTGELAPSKTSHFTFAVFGGSQGDHKSPAIISRIFEAIHEYQPKRPAFAFCLGDIVKGKDPQDPAKFIKQKFADLLELATTAGFPDFNAPGNVKNVSPYRAACPTR